MSYVLNKTGFPSRKSARYTMVSGGDNMQYIYRVNDMLLYMADTFGKPDKSAKSPTTSDFAGMKGIIVVKGHGWGDAKGHVTLSNGQSCSDSCHLMSDPDNGIFIPEVASLWNLP
ncbi:MAG: hypothetical protein D3M94_01680 [Rhodocyclales bacterium GT-UBC]|nr:MAG: hypothetical protein D3M94_01680 [Rhodocyclales bacterium GT-UBC]